MAGPQPAGERSRLLDSPSKPAANAHHNLLGLPPGQFRALCTSVWVASFFVALDSTIVATLVSDIGSYFEASNQASWLGTSYLLSICCFTPIYGRLSDLIGRREAHLVGGFFFLLGTIGCALAPSMDSLIAARAVAGVGGGGVQSMSVIIISDLVSVRYRGLFQGYANLAFGAGSALGGPIGGWIAETLGWRTAFGFQVPLIALSMIAVFWLARLPAQSSPAVAGEGGKPSIWRKLRRIDFLGSLLLILAIGLLVLSLSLKTSTQKADGSEYEWSDPLVWGLFVGSLVSAVAFVMAELYVAPQPILPLELLTRRTPGAIALSSFTVVFNQFSLTYNLPLFFTAVRLTSTSSAGAHLFAYTAICGVASLACGWIVRRTGRYYWINVSGGLCMVASWGMICLWSPSSSEALTWVAQIPNGLGYTIVLTASLVALMNDVWREGKGEQAVATSMSYMFRTTGQVLGVSLSAAIVQAITLKDLGKAIQGPHAKDVIDRIRHSTSAIRTLEPAYRDAAVQAYNHALHVVFLLDLALAIISVAVICVIKEEPMPEQVKAPSEDSDNP